jgi:hypothetical protein
MSVEVANAVRLEVLNWGGSGRAVVLLAGGGDTAHVFESPTHELNENLTNLLVELFPKTEYAYSVSHTIHADLSETEWEKTYRVATTRYFDAYFQLTLAPSEVSVAEVSRLTYECSDESKCFASLTKIREQGKLKATMDSLRFRLQEVPPENLPALLGALIRIGDVASESGTIFAGQIPEYWHVRWAIFDVLERIPAADRPAALSEIGRRIFAPKMMVNVITLIEELRRTKNQYEEFTDELLATVKRNIAGRIRNAAVGGEIPEAPESLSILLYAWRQWGDPAEAAAYVNSLTDTDSGLAAFLNKFIYQTHSAGLSDRVTRTHNRLAMKQLSESLDLNLLRERLSQIDVKQLNNENRDIIRFALEQLQKMHKLGLTPERFDNSRFFLD